MSEYGFFWDSMNGDRKYNAASMEEWLRKFFVTGVFNGELQVTATTGMTVSVSAGYCNIDGKVMHFTSAKNFTLEVASGIANRVDTIVIERNDTDRTFYLKAITGIDGEGPTAPVRTGGVYQLVLAQIAVNAGVTEITGADITDTRTDPDLCGYVASTVTEMDFSQFAAQFASYYEQFVENNEADFMDWFEHLQDILDTDVAAHLQNEIDAINTLLSIRTATLTAGQETITINDARINSNTIFSFYTSVYGVNPKEVTVNTGSVTLKFAMQTNDVIVGVKIDG